MAALTRDCREGHHRRCVLPGSCDCGCHHARTAPTLTRAPAQKANTGGPQFMHIPLDQIAEGKNVRLDEGDVDTLAESIRKHGVLQPITVVPLGGSGRVECLFGHRRLKAARLAGLDVIPCLYRPRDRAEVRVLTQLAENRDRRQMTKLEEALVYDELRSLGMSQRAIADAVGTHEGQVSMRLALLQYPESVKNAVHLRKIGITDALAIPLELARAADPRTLAAACRHGGAHLRKWVRERVAAEHAAGREIVKRGRFETFNVDSDLIDEIRAAAAGDGLKVVEWIRRAVRAALDARRIEEAAS